MRALVGDIVGSLVGALVGALVCALVGGIVGALVGANELLLLLLSSCWSYHGAAKFSLVLPYSRWCFRLSYWALVGAIVGAAELSSAHFVIVRQLRPTVMHHLNRNFSSASSFIWNCKSQTKSALFISQSNCHSQGSPDSTGFKGKSSSKYKFSLTFESENFIRCIWDLKMIKPTLAVTKWRNRKEVGRLCNPGQILEDSLQRGRSKHFTINFLKESLKHIFFSGRNF